MAGVLLVGLGVLAAGCETGSTPEGCGDGVVTIPEVCDDANTISGDGCTMGCVTEAGWTCAGAPSVCTERPMEGVCGDGVQNIGEECDDGRETGACDPDCTLYRCGDGFLNVSAGETCDDMNTSGGDGCSALCRIEVAAGCGNAICDFDEDCVICPADCECRDCPDRDEDGHTDSACGGDDCNDFDAAVSPDGVEVTCNGLDEDCDPATPDAVDADGDGSSCNYDCDDTDPFRSPLFFEQCGNGVDDDCSEDTDDVLDRDGDGFACDADCNDFSPTVCPTCDELCANAVDDDCDPATPDLFDGDGDGAVCDRDCDDDDAAVRPGVRELCGNAVDDDCSATTPDIFDRDADGDDCRSDCDDDDAARASTFSEVCGNYVDDDCDALTADLEDADADTFDCDIDCDDADAAVVPDASLFCGPRVMYFEDFEAGPGGWTASGASSSWAHGVPSATFISAAASGANAWVTNLTGLYRNNELSYLTSPAIDMSAALTDPVLSFSHIFETEPGFDLGWVEISTDGGSTWAKLGRTGDGANWYGDEPVDVWNATSGGAGVWRTAQIVLTGLAGVADARIRFVFDSDSSSLEEGFGVDDVRIDNEVVDLGVVAVGLPSRTCRTSTHPIAVTVRNLGSVLVSGFTVSYAVDAGGLVSELVSESLLPGQSLTHLFTARADLSALGGHVVEAGVAAAGDSVAANDSLPLSVSVDDAPFITLGAGYSEDFEADAGGFTAGGSNSTWAWGAPSATFISGAASGTRAWVTNLTGEHDPDEDSTLTSGCFDFSAAATDPQLSFSHTFDATEGEGWIEIFTSATNRWETLGRMGTGTNWYNRTGVWDGTSSTGAWRTAAHPLTGTAGQPVVRIRHRFTSYVLFFGGEGFGIDDVTIVP